MKVQQREKRDNLYMAFTIGFGLIHYLLLTNKTEYNQSNFDLIDIKINNWNNGFLTTKKEVNQLIITMMQDQLIALASRRLIDPLKDSSMNYDRTKFFVPTSINC